MKKFQALSALVFAGASCSSCLPTIALDLYDGEPDGRVLYHSDPKFENEVGFARGRLSRASGVSFEEHELGTPINAVDTYAQKRVHTEPNGDEWVSYDCGQTLVSHIKSEVISVRIDIPFPSPPGCMSDVSRTIEHEIIHSIRRDLELTNQDQHATTGVFKAYADDTDNHLTAESLEKLCEGIECTLFNTEE